MAIKDSDVGIMAPPQTLRRSQSTERLHVYVNDRVARCPPDVLMTVSPLLEHRARVAALENREFRIKVDSEVEGAIVLYLETGSCPIEFETLNLLTYTAYKNKMATLLDECQHLYLSQLIPLNCLEIMMFAESHGCEKLETVAFALALENFEEISKTSQFCHVGKSQLMRLILDPLLHVRSRDVVHEALERWCAYEQNVRLKDRDEMLKAFSQALSGRARTPAPSLHAAGFTRHRILSGSNALPSKRRKVSNDPLTPPPSYEKVEALSPVKPTGTVVCVGRTAFELEVIFISFPENGHGDPSISTYVIPRSEGLDDDTAFCHNFEYIYACGGREKPDSSARFDLQTKKWLKQQKMFNDGRMSHMLCYLNERVYAMGGINTTTGRVFEYVDKYVVQSNKWTDAGKLQELVKSASCVSVGHDIYVFGGIRSDGAQSKSVQCYSTATKKTRQVGLIPIESPITRAVTDKNVVYLFAANGDVLEFNPYTDDFKKLPSLTKVLSSFGTFVQNGYLFVFGGNEGRGPHGQPSTEVLRLDLRNRNSGWAVSTTLPRPVNVHSCSDVLLGVG